MPESFKCLVRLTKVYTFKNCVFRSNDHFLLSVPYNNYIVGIGPHPTDKWLDEWYEKEWPFHREWLAALAAR